MRYLLGSVAFCFALPVLSPAALADVFDIPAPVREVTLHPDGALVLRRAEIDLPAGAHQLIIPGLPGETDPDNLRIAAEGATIGAVSLQMGRALPDGRPESQAVKDARAEVERLELVLRERDAATAAIRAEAEAANDLLSFLRTLASSDGAATGDVGALTDLVGDRMLAARRAGIAAETRAIAAEQGREQDARALEEAIARLNALQQPDSDKATLVITVEGQGAPAAIAITALSWEARWRPVYDLRLDQEAKTLVLERGLMVAQGSGEDWSDVMLTLSTSRLDENTEPTELYERIVRAFDPERQQQDEAMEMASAPMAEGGYVAPVLEVEPVVADRASVDFMGVTAVYHYDAPVDIRSGVDALRLKLDEQALPVEALVAEAVPSRDDRAYIVVDTKNPMPDPILPGRATLFVDGNSVGQTDLELVASGEEMQPGFGVIDGIVLDRRTPGRESAGGGWIRRAAAMTEEAVLEAKNLTGRDYVLRMIDQVPVSEQKEVTVAWEASVAPTEENPDGKRGLLVWEMPIAAGATQEITLKTEIRWPDGQELIE